MYNNDPRQPYDNNPLPGASSEPPPGELRELTEEELASGFRWGGPLENENATISVLHKGHHLKPEETYDPWPILLKDRPNPQIRLIYNVFASAYDEYMKELNYVAPTVLAHYLQNELRLDPNCFILDLGCGTGLVGDALQECGFTNIEGADISEEMVRTIRRVKTCYAAEVHMVNVTPTATLRLRLRPYECIIMAATVMPGHITPQCLPNIIESLLAPGGLLVWISPSLSHLAMHGRDFEEQKFMSFIRAACSQAGATLIARVDNVAFIDGVDGEIFALQKK